MSAYTTTKTKVQITVEIDGVAPWPGSVSLDTVYKQSIEHAKSVLSDALMSRSNKEMRIVGVIKVVGVIFEKDLNA